MKLALLIGLLVGLFILLGCVNGYGRRRRRAPPRVRRTPELDVHGPVSYLPICHRQSETPYDCNSSCIDSGKKLYLGTVDGMSMTGSQVLCDGKTDGGGWVVFQRRWNKSVNFNQNWNNYKEGFGKKEGEFWWGFENLHRFTTEKNCELYIIAKSSTETFHERYTKFEITSEKDGYKLLYGTRTQRIGFKKLDALALSKKESLSTKDKGWDSRTCAKEEEGGWWYKKRGQCTDAKLNSKEMFWGGSRVDYSQMMVRCYPDDEPIPGLPTCHLGEQYDCGSLCIDPGRKLYRSRVDKMPIERSEVLCEDKRDAGGWVVFQRRWNTTQGFNRGWEQYKNGFGNIEGDFWWGNENLHLFTKNRYCELYVIMKSDWERFEERYTKFRIESEYLDYRMQYETRHEERGYYELDALEVSNGETFSTYDHGYDRELCASKKEGGWWYRNRHKCTDSMLNGKKMVWGQYAIEYSQMMVRCYPFPRMGPIPDFPICRKGLRFDCKGQFCVNPLSRLYQASVVGMPLSMSEVLCSDTRGGGWVVFQLRWGAVEFNRDWEEYKNGFEDIRSSAFWWGNEKLHQYTRNKNCELHITISAGMKMIQERYTKFWISSEHDGYKLHYDKRAEGYNQPDSDPLAVSKGETFSTNDYGYDSKTCATTLKGGWWYRKRGDCTDSMLNGEEMVWGPHRVRMPRMMVRCDE